MSDKLVLATRISPEDNVATLLEDADAGEEVAVRCPADPGKSLKVACREAIPMGHKIALSDVPAGGAVRKYGAPIAYARETVRQGALVHVQNVRSGVAQAGPSASVSEGEGAARPARVSATEFKQTVRSWLIAQGVADRAAEAFADHVLEAHLRGVETHGLRRLAPYAARIRAGGVDPLAEPSLDDRRALLNVDGRNGIGHLVASEAAEAVCRAAAENGAAVALIRNSNHFGFAGYYASRIAEKGMLAIVTSNGQPIMGPEGARRAVLSNDPIAVAAALDDGRFFEFDMAMSVTSRAKIAQAAEKGEAIAEGLGQDADGNPTTDAAAALGGAVLPFGGMKGFALTVAIELITGVLSGGAYADLVASKEADANAPEGAAHFMLAIDLSATPAGEDFPARARDLIRRVESVEMRPGSEAVRAPGARRWRLRAERLSQGIPLSPADVASFNDLAGELGKTDIG